jgi:hypothetical protein
VLLFLHKDNNLPGLVANFYVLVDFQANGVAPPFRDADDVRVRCGERCNRAFRCGCGLRQHLLAL